MKIQEKFPHLHSESIYTHVGFYNKYNRKYHLLKFILNFILNQSSNLNSIE